MTETQNTSRRPGALIAMSGGVDSSVAAWLMQRDGFDCTGVTMRLTRNEAVNTEGLHTCCSERDIEDAAEVAYAMDIPYEVLDFTADFQEKIIDKFIRVYEAGGTPNPCIDCNRYMKFDHLLRWAEAHGLDHVVTGHYARVEQDEATGRWLLKKGLDENKDQSYVLYNLTQEQLAHVRLPLGGLHKSEVRAIAEEQAAAPAFDEEKWERARKARDKRFRVLQEEPGAWRVTGTNLERMVVQTDWENEEAIIYLQHRMARMGVDDALIKAGCKNGDEVRILGYAFDFEGIDDDEDYEDDVEFIEFDVDDEELATEDSQPEVGEEGPDVLA